jgi:predicted lipid-binding transport protein (Tim44 family)
MPGARVDTIIGIAPLLLLAGCQGGMPRAGVGTAAGGLGGAAAGGLLGAALGGGSTGIASGVLIGGLLGGGAGQLMDQRTQRIQSEAVARALETTPAGASFLVDESRRRDAGKRYAPPDIPEPGRRLLPGVPAVDRRRRPDSASGQHRVPAIGRHVADPELRRRRKRCAGFPQV